MATRRNRTYTGIATNQFLWSFSFLGSDDVVVFASPEADGWHSHVKKNWDGETTDREVSLTEYEVLKDGVVIARILLIGTALNKMPDCALIKGKKMNSWA